MNLGNKNEKYYDFVYAETDANGEQIHHKTAEKCINYIREIAREEMNEVGGVTMQRAMSQDAKKFYENLRNNLEIKQKTSLEGTHLPETEVIRVQDNIVNASPLLKAVKKIGCKNAIINVVLNGSTAGNSQFGQLTSQVQKEITDSYKIMKLELGKLSCYSKIS